MQFGHLSKAFDCIPQGLLIAKLEVLDFIIAALASVVLFLKNWKQLDPYVGLSLGFACKYIFQNSAFGFFMRVIRVFLVFSISWSVNCTLWLKKI